MGSLREGVKKGLPESATTLTVGYAEDCTSCNAVVADPGALLASPSVLEAVYRATATKLAALGQFALSSQAFFTTYQVQPMVPVEDVADLSAFVANGGLALWQPHRGGGPGPLAVKLAALLKELAHLDAAERAARREAGRAARAVRKSETAAPAGEGGSGNAPGPDPGGEPAGGDAEDAGPAFELPAGVLEAGNGGAAPEPGAVVLRVCCLDAGTYLTHPFSSQQLGEAGLGALCATLLQRLDVEAPPDIAALQERFGLRLCLPLGFNFPAAELAGRGGLLVCRPRKPDGPQPLHRFMSALVAKLRMGQARVGRIQELVAAGKAEEALRELSHSDSGGLARNQGVGEASEADGRGLPPSSAFAGAPMGIEARPTGQGAPAPAPSGQLSAAALGALGSSPAAFGPRPADPAVPRPVPATNGGFAGGAINPIISPKDTVVAAPRSSSALGSAASWGGPGQRTPALARGSGNLDAAATQLPDWLAVGTFAGGGSMNGLRRSASPSATPGTSTAAAAQGPAPSGGVGAGAEIASKPPDAAAASSETGDSSRTTTPPAPAPVPAELATAPAAAALGGPPGFGSAPAGAFAGQMRMLMQPGQAGAGLEGEGGGLRVAGSGVDASWRARSPEGAGSAGEQDAPSVASMAARLSQMRPGGVLGGLATSPGSNRSASLSSQPVSPASFGRGMAGSLSGLDPGALGLGGAGAPLGLLPGPSRLRSGMPQVRMEDLLRSGRASPSGTAGAQDPTGATAATMLGQRRRTLGPEGIGGTGGGGPGGGAGGGGGGVSGASGSSGEPIAHLSQWQREHLAAQLQIQQLNAQVQQLNGWQLPARLEQHQFILEQSQAQIRALHEALEGLQGAVRAHVAAAVGQHLEAVRGQVSMLVTSHTQRQMHWLRERLDQQDANQAAARRLQLSERQEMLRDLNDLRERVAKLEHGGAIGPGGPAPAGSGVHW